MRNNMHWRSGYAAYDQGHDRCACNHDPESVEWAYWQQGFTDAEQDDKWLATEDWHPGDEED